MAAWSLARWGVAPVLTFLLAVAGLGLVFLAYERFPVSYVWLVAEDSWGENATFLAWLLSFVVLGRALSANRDLRRPGIVLFAVAALFIAFEEISWGQRILDFEAPELFRRYNRQSEFTFHNFAPNPDREPIGLILLIGTVLPYLACRLLPGLRALLHRWGLPTVPLRLWPLLFVTAWLFYDPLHLPKIDEISELFLGVCALLFALEIVKPSPEDDNARSIATMVSVVVVGSVLMTSVLGRESDYRRWLNEFASSRFPHRGQLQQSAWVFEYLAGRPELRRDDTWLDYAAVLAALGEHERARQVATIGLEAKDARLKLKSRDERAHRQRGSLLVLMGRQDDALPSFHRALELDRSRLRRCKDPAEEVELRWSIAQTFYAMGRFEEARQESQKAADMASDENSAKKIHRWLEWEERRTEALGSPRVLSIAPESDES